MALSVWDEIIPEVEVTYSRRHFVVQAQRSGAGTRTITPCPRIQNVLSQARKN